MTTTEATPMSIIGTANGRSILVRDQGLVLVGTHGELTSVVLDPAQRLALRAALADEDLPDPRDVEPGVPFLARSGDTLHVAVRQRHAIPGTEKGTPWLLMAMTPGLARQGIVNPGSVTLLAEYQRLGTAEASGTDPGTVAPTEPWLLTHGDEGLCVGVRNGPVFHEEVDWAIISLADPIVRFPANGDVTLVAPLDIP